MQAVHTAIAFTHYSETRSGALLVASLLACGVLWKIGWGYRILYAVILAGYFFVNATLRVGGRAPRVDLTGKIALVTGANTGIGKETAIALAEQGATVVIACRDSPKTTAALAEIRQRSRSDKIDSITVDMSSFASVRTAAAAFLAKYQQLDILINNAGVAFASYGTTKDGLETMIHTNHYGAFLFTNLLMPALKKAQAARVINLSSMAHLLATSIPSTPPSSTTHDKFAAYAESKLANIYFTLHLQRLLRQVDSPITVYAVHPGAVATEIQRHNHPIIGQALTVLSHVFMKTPVEGAQTSLYCAVSPSAVAGGYHLDCHSEPLLPAATDTEKAKELWERSERITGSKFTV